MKENISEQEFEQLIDEYGTQILRLCYLYLKDYQLAEDACQDTFLSVYRNIGNFKKASSIKTWITKICINTCKNYLRSSWAKRIILNDKKIRAEKYIEKPIMEESELMTLIMDLNRKQKEVILMFYYQEFSTKEIASILNISESNVCTRLSRARKCLRIEVEGALV
ncbi:RNA polymerase sigma factor [Vallitalea pronyensis]|uniref:RNA polymerase sigma factor n=1 Tax=Vallitalea pronyensis TaxID=1348613 RepID=UPI001FE6FE01|nr:sigma-70 family RNA polymerase sigma factor [Vallitalea pronyensis]